MGLRYRPKKLQGPIPLQRMTLLCYRTSYRQILALNSKSQYLGLIYFKDLPKNENVRKSHKNNNNSDNPITSRRTDGGKNEHCCFKSKLVALSIGISITFPG